jgi:lipid-A-disaccharide synthase
VRCALPLLDAASPEREAMLDGYGRLTRALGEPGVTDRAASAILDQLNAGAGAPQAS